MKNLASPAPGCRRRRLPIATVAALFASLQVPGGAFANPPDATPSCSAPGTGWCAARRFPGSIKNGELGFRFGEPLDADGDGHADVAAGARFKLQNRTQQNGIASVWSGATGTPIHEWDGEWADGLFGHWTLLVPDLSGDGLADVIIAAPHAPVNGVARGAVVARSPKTGAELWNHSDGLGHQGGIISYSAGGKQFIAVTAGFGGMLTDGWGDAFGEPYKSMPRVEGVLVVYSLK